MKMISTMFAVAGAMVASAYKSEYIPSFRQSVTEKVVSPLPYTYFDPPAQLNWANINGTSYVTKMLNQHLPQYCGSCWAHGSLSALADRVKIARHAQGVDINLSVQYILNCGNAGSCHGGDELGVYQFIASQPGGVPHDTCQPYLACSSDSSEGFCSKINTQCSAINTCRTCNTFSSSGGKCVEIDYYPNVTVAEYGTVVGEDKMIAEISARGPIACGVNAEPLIEYTGGVYTAGGDQGINHIISVIGYGTDASGTNYWIARNSWGEYWGEMGYFRIERGQNMLGIESDCVWATPLAWTETNYGCYEDGSNCIKSVHYVDPSVRKIYLCYLISFSYISYSNYVN
jgi:cathepsin X